MPDPILALTFPRAVQRALACWSPRLGPHGVSRAPSNPPPLSWQKSAPTPNPRNL